jgi:hypothetical protein
MSTWRESYQIIKPRRLHLAGIMAALLAGSVALSPRLVAQSPAPAENTVQAGDHWTFDSRDEVTGSPRDTFTRVVTEISPGEVVVRLSFRGKSGFATIVYDHSWNRVESSTVKWKPNDGQGIRAPLAAGKEWRSDVEARNSQAGAAFKMTVLSKITAQEQLTLRAGMFDTFKIETRIHQIAASDPSKYWDYENVSWYAPQINHWVRRMLVTKAQKRTTESVSEELIDFGRRL